MLCDTSIYTFYAIKLYINIPRLLILNSWLKNIENLWHHLSREKYIDTRNNPNNIRCFF